MSYINAYVTSSGCENIGKVIQNEFGCQVEGIFQWKLPASIPMLMNNYWAVTMKQIFLTDKIGLIKKNEDYKITIGDEVYFLADKTSCITEWREMSKVLSSFSPFLYSR